MKTFYSYDVRDSDALRYLYKVEQKIADVMGRNESQVTQQ
jgi:hypothetical protein